MSYKILTLNNISVRGLERLPRDRFVIKFDDARRLVLGDGRLHIYD